MNSARPNSNRTDKPIRVAIVHYRDDTAMGGAIRVGETLANNFDPKKIEAHLVFAYGGAGTVSSRVRVPVHYLEAKSAKDAAAWIRARRIVKEIKADIFHFMDPALWVFGATFGLPAKRLQHFHGKPIVAEISIMNKAIMTARRYLCDGFISITHGALRAAVDAGFADRATASTVYNGVNVEFFETLPSKAEARTQLNLPQSANLIGQVVRLVKGNGCDDLLTLIRLLPEEWHAVFVGDGPYRLKLEQSARDLGLSRRVHFTGLLEDVRPAYAALDAVVLLACYQSFCLMLGEAMAAGVPVFGLLGDGEYAEPENPLVTAENSVFIPRAKPDDYFYPEPIETFMRLAERVSEYGRHPERFSQMIVNAYQHVRHRFTAKMQADAMTEVYFNLLNLKKNGYEEN
jgi:glycosyltransferase involved in cell wall biosynthesis